MMPNLQTLGIDQLSPEVRLHLIGEIWDSLSDEALGEIPESHREELDRRLAERERNPQATSPWEAVRDRIRNKLRDQDR